MEATGEPAKKEKEQKFTICSKGFGFALLTDKANGLPAFWPDWGKRGGPFYLFRPFPARPTACLPFGCIGARETDLFIIQTFSGRANGLPAFSRIGAREAGLFIFFGLSRQGQRPACLFGRIGAREAGLFIFFGLSRQGQWPAYLLAGLEQEGRVFSFFQTFPGKTDAPACFVPERGSAVLAFSGPLRAKLPGFPAFLMENRRAFQPLGSFMVRPMRFLAGSTFSTHTFTISPTFSTSLGCLIYLSQIWEMCTRPS